MPIDPERSLETFTDWPDIPGQVQHVFDHAQECPDDDYDRMVKGLVDALTSVETNNCARLVAVAFAIAPIIRIAEDVRKSAAVFADMLLFMSTYPDDDQEDADAEEAVPEAPQ